MTNFLYALIPVLAWGTWLAPSQNVHFRNQQIKTFYVAVANLVLSTFVVLIWGSPSFSQSSFWFPLLGGLIWAFSAYCAFTATDKIGTARAFGIWAPLNIIVSMIWGALIFNEFIDTSLLSKGLLVAAVIIIIAGVLIIIFARGKGEKQQDRKTLLVGVLGAVGAGILWGTYFIPIQLVAISMWSAVFPLTIGIFIGSLALALITRQPFGLEKREDYWRTSATGILWGIGNYGMLLLVAAVGTGKGFTIAQLSIVVNALIGIYILKNPQPRTRAASMTLVGCVMATLGAIILGNL
jgi:glucose uptake protein